MRRGCRFFVFNDTSALQLVTARDNYFKKFTISIKPLVNLSKQLYIVARLSKHPDLN